MTKQTNNQGIIPSTDVKQLTLTLKVTTAQVVETSVTVNNNIPIQDYVHPDDQSQPTFYIDTDTDTDTDTRIFPFTKKSYLHRAQ